MELELYRIDYTIVGLTSTNCLGLLPNNPKQQQRFVIADNDGILQMISIKKDDIQLHFKTLPGKSITSMKLAGAIGTPNDKIFVASDNEVKGYTKKGKLFLTFDPGMTEAINSMCVLGNDLFLCGNHIFNHYKDCKGIGSYLCGDKIVDVIAFFAQKSKRLISLIACEGRMIRSLEHARVTCSMEVENSPTVLHIYESDQNKIVLFGTVDGRIGILDVENTQSFDRWLVTNEQNKAPISCIDSYDLTGTGVKNLIVGRQDGNVEVYNVNINDNLDTAVLIYLNNFNEFITSLQCGIIGCDSFDEILVATYTGRIFGLTTNIAKDCNFQYSSQNVNNSQKIAKLKSELDDLHAKVLKEREKYQNLTQSFFDELSAIPLLSVKENFTLSKETSTYTLTIEVPTAIDNVLLQSNVSIELLDVEKNSAVISRSETNEQDGNFLLATYRCQLNTNRLELNLRTSEGQRGTLQVYITPLVQPKCTRLLQYDIKSLSLHYKLHSFTEHRPFNMLTIKGPFSLAEIHSWISQCLPEITQKPQSIEKNELWFQSALIGSVLRCVYQKGEATFESDNVSTISILKESLTIEATKKKIRIELSISINDETINFILNLLEPKLIHNEEIQKKIILANALIELGVTEEESKKYLSTKYKNLLEEQVNLKKEDALLSGTFNKLHGAIINLYLDYNKFKGRNTQSSIPKLKKLLENFSCQSLIEFFRPTDITN